MDIQSHFGLELRYRSEKRFSIDIGREIRYMHFYNTSEVVGKVKIKDTKELLDYTFASGGDYEFNKAMDIYGHDILRYCHNILCDYFEAEDAVQVTFIKAYEKRKNFKEGTSLSAWLYRIAYTTCIDITRKNKFKIFSNKDIKKDEPIYKDSYISDELKEALMELSPKERALIFSRVLDEKDYGELEIIYDASAQTLRKRYERAKKKLAKVLKESKKNY